LETNFIIFALITPLLICSFLNLFIAFFFLFKIRTNAVDHKLSLSSSEFDLLQKQYLFLQTQSEIETKRLDTVEKVLSVMLSTTSQRGGDNGFAN
jgi:hypothetical protein